jgi:hypothetical protein
MASAEDRLGVIEATAFLEPHPRQMNASLELYDTRMDGETANAGCAAMMRGGRA